MTDQPRYIAKPPVLKLAEDFYRLRQEGISFIEEMGTELWTDYNAHDPGITILEALCYGITELAYRTGWDIKDILTPDPAKKKAADQPYPGQYFPSAREILTVNPVTPDDFRRLLIDLKEVRNAWVIKAECDKKNNGLYDVLLELEEDIIPDNVNYDPKENIFVFGDFEISLKIERLKKKQKNEISDEYFLLKKEYVAKYIEYRKREENIWIRKVIKNKKKDKYFIFRMHIHNSAKKVDCAKLSSFCVDAAKIYFYIFLTKEVLHDNRNLCEDYCCINIVQNEKIRVYAEIDLRPDADVNSVYEHILLEIENYLNPSIPFQTLVELVEKKEKIEEIFNGPQVENGFIQTEELKSASFREDIYLSDIINTLIPTEGVVAIRCLRLINGSNGNNKWKKHIDGKKKLRLDIIESDFIFYKNGFPFIIKNKEKSKDRLSQLRREAERGKSEFSKQDIPIPTGTFRNLNEYFPVQYSLPTAYGIGPDGLPAQASDERRARAKQLQGYLMPFEQILANAFSQLEHVGDLFSLDLKNNHSYAVKEFDDEIISGIEEIFNSIHEFSDLGSESGKDIDCMEQCPIKAKCEATGDQDCINFWNEESSQECNAAVSYARKTIDEILPKYNQQERRNRFLDHLLARFGEHFDDYRILNQDEDKTTTIKDLIEDKISFIKIQQEIGSERAKAFNYTRNNGNYLECIELENEYLYIVTDSNVPELKRRVSLLLGCPDLHFFWKKRNTNGKIFFDLCLSDKNKKTWKPENSWINYYFEIREINIDSIKNKLTKKSINILRLLSEYMDTPICIDIEANFISRIDELLRWSIFQRAIVVEHILLRPKPAIKEQDDQYSFQLTFVIPGWHGLNNSDQTSRESFITMRNFTERIIRQETPAHLFVNILWVDEPSFSDFECAWCNWLAAQAEEKNVEKYRSAVLSKLCKLKNTYPSAKLHVPTNDTSENKHPARLGQAILGSLPNDRPKRLGEIVLENTDGRQTRLGEVILDSSNGGALK